MWKAGRIGATPVSFAGQVFFPHSQSLGIDPSDASPAVQRKITCAGTVGRSFAESFALTKRGWTLADKLTGKTT